MNNEIRLERERRKTYVSARMADSFQNMTSSIPLQLVAAFAIIEVLQGLSWQGGDGVHHHAMGSAAGSILEAGLIALPFVTELAKSKVLEEAIRSGAGVAEKAGSLAQAAVPLLLTAGAV